jgi:Peptidase S24-like
VDIKGLMKVGENRLLFPIFISENGKYESIEIVPVKASAGYLKGYADPEFLEALPRMELPFFGPGSYRGFQIEGDSMIPIPSGSHIVGRYVEDLNDVKDGKTYIVITNEGITYKKVLNKIQTDGTLQLIPYNKYYKTVSIKAEEVIELWAFQCFISTKEYKDEELMAENFLPTLSNIGNGIEEIKSLINSQFIGKKV